MCSTLLMCVVQPNFVSYPAGLAFPLFIVKEMSVSWHPCVIPLSIHSTQTHTHTTHTHTCTHTHVHTHRHTLTTHTQTHTHTHAHIHVHTYTYTHTDTAIPTATPMSVSCITIVKICNNHFTASGMTTYSHPVSCIARYCLTRDSWAQVVISTSANRSLQWVWDHVKSCGSLWMSGTSHPSTNWTMIGDVASFLDPMDEGAGCSEDQDPRLSPKTSDFPVSSYSLQ